jgi:hypothetical protein
MVAAEYRLTFIGEAADKNIPLDISTRYIEKMYSG